MLVDCKSLCPGIGLHFNGPARASSIPKIKGYILTATRDLNRILFYIPFCPAVEDTADDLSASLDFGKKKKKKSKSKDAEGGEAAGGDEEAEDLDDDLNLVSNILGSIRCRWLFLRPFCLQICSLYIRWLTL